MRKVKNPLRKRNKWAVKLRWTAFFLLTSLLFILSVSLYAASKWIGATFGVGFEELLFTLSAPLKGTDTGVVWECVRSSVPEIKLMAVYLAAGVVLWRVGCRGTLVLSLRSFSHRWGMDLLSLLRLCMALLCAASVGYSLWFADTQFQIADYIETRMSASTLYEDYYVDPSGVDITGEGKNLIFIYMESMETAYASQSVGGFQPDVNYIPHLTQLAQENTSFSNTSRLGGFRPVSGALNTVCAVFSTTSGIPYSFPIAENTMGRHQTFASGVTNLGDILAAKGYQNEFICGSDSSHGGKRDYFTQHGDYKIFDLYTARETGYVPPEYHNEWWGYEDEILYKIAKDELTTLAQSGQPFNLTLLTVDTHFPEGYLCGLCGEEYDTKAANVVACADRQIAEFVAWCQKQDFYKDTVIVITGDHPRMDLCLIEGMEYRDRTVYNCFLNCDLPARTENRECTALDIFPSVLAALGFQVEGERLGLGVNLFSDTPTLSETMGFDALDKEASKYSAFYLKHFA